MSIYTFMLELETALPASKDGLWGPMASEAAERREGVGTIWGRKPPPRAAESYKAPQPCPPVWLPAPEARPTAHIHWENIYTARAAQLKHQRSRLIP